jgi:hypothetical protein
MTAIKGRVARLERASGLHQAPEDEDSRKLRRFEEILHQLPSPVVRLFISTCRAIEVGEPLTTEQQAVKQHFNVFWETGAWPT